MANKKIMLGMLAATLLAFEIVLAGCDDESGGGGNVDLTGPYTRSHYSLAFTTNTFSFSHGYGSTVLLSGIYTYNSTTLTLTVSGVPLTGNATRSDSNLELSGFGVYAQFFDGICTKY
jgi:hypothetical protein